METKKSRLSYFMKINGLKYDDLIDDKTIVSTENLRVSLGRDNNKADYYLKLIATKYNISEQWLFEGQGEMFVNNEGDNQKKKKFDDLSIEEKLNYLHEENTQLREKVRLSHLIERTYLRTIIKHMGIKQEEIKEAEIMEDTMKKISSN
ncbi:hypothetical protein [uncultured Chryseobacterium sp.]|uniref:hypothetical protein n=1 Tax=uncultured Chryseobacterium sp. TaxID=259322 RepID=UPI0025DBDA86|nr:hypothetical protein [uncultured Chryseobacterium sp.]